MTVKIERKLAKRWKRRGYVELGSVVWMSGVEECVLIK